MVSFHSYNSFIVSGLKMLIKQFLGEFNFQIDRFCGKIHFIWFGCEDMILLYEIKIMHMITL